MNRRTMMLGVAAAALATLSLEANAQPKSEVTFSRQPGINYMGTHIIEKQKLIEKHAEKLGVAGLKVNWLTMGGGGAQTDAMLAGSVDVANTGVTNLLLLWDRTKGGVKGIVATSAQPLALITRDPNIKTLNDLKEGDKIAVPTLKVSTQSMLLQIQAVKMFGQKEWAKFDQFTVQLAHPDAAVIMTNPQHEVKSHFAAPPFQYFELKTVPGARAVISSFDIMGGPMTQAGFFTTTKFADANPKIIEAVRLAAEEAEGFIRSNTREAVEIYREGTKDRMSTDDLLAILKEPGMMEYGGAPQNTLKIAEHLFQIGTLKGQAKAWTDNYLPVAHSLKGS